jgi:arylsulfatase A-like enzyme
MEPTGDKANGRSRRSSAIAMIPDSLGEIAPLRFTRKNEISSKGEKRLIRLRSTFRIAGLLALATVLALAARPVSAQQKKPNILVIMTDDVGVWNVSAYHRGMMGGRTPNIDRIANEGALFTDYYAQQSCTAGRAAFITGQHPFRTGLLAVGMPGSPLGLQKEDPTIAELLKPLGYATAQIGKNHLGDRNEFLPTVHGFDEFYGNLYHLNSEEEPEDLDYPKNPAFHEKFGPRGMLRCVALTSDNPAPPDPRFGAWGRQKCEDTGPLTRKRMETVEEDMLQVSLDFIDKSVKGGKPFFLWHNTSRMHVWTRLSPRWENKSGYGLFADGMMELDWVVGELLKKLDDLGIAQNTIVVFTADNGAEKFSWPDGGTEPFRGEKGTTWEGGFRVPCLARWPGVIKPGTIINDIASHEDWMPTFLAAVGVPDVKERLLRGYQAGDKTFRVHLDAYDLTDLLSGKGPGQRREIFYFDDSGSLNAFRYGDWKVIFAVKDSWWADVAKPRTVPLVVNLRQDPFEVSMDSAMYTRWYGDKLWVMLPAQAIVGQFLLSFKEFPQRQRSSAISVTGIQDVLDRMQKQDD